MDRLVRVTSSGSSEQLDTFDSFLSIIRPFDCYSEIVEHEMTTKSISLGDRTALNSCSALEEELRMDPKDGRRRLSPSLFTCG